jgi:RNA polymerase sigma factor (sigma-70 family)
VEQYAFSSDPVTAPSDDDAVLQAADSTPLLSTAQAKKLEQDFAIWLRPLVKELRRYAYYLCKSREVSEELVQEAATKLYKVWHLDERRELIKSRKGYAFTAVKAAFIDLYRVPSRTNRFEREFQEEEQTANGPQKGLDLETIWTIREAVRKLDDDERLLVFLIYYQGDNVSVAGKHLGLDSNRAHRMHKSALARLRSILAIIQ